MLDGAATRVTATMNVERTAAAAEPLVLNGSALEALCRSNATARSWMTPFTPATTQRWTLFAPPASFTLEIVTEIASGAEHGAGGGLYMSNGIYCTQCEPEGFRAITYYLDRPDNLAKFETRIEAAKTTTPVLLSNGNLIESGDLPGNRHYALWRDPFPKPSYLFALVAGDLAHISDSFTTASGRKVDLRVYVEHGNEAKAGYAMDSLKRSMRWDEEAYGREYDLDIFMIVAVSAFNFGAMENKGLNIFNDKVLLASPETATDDDYGRIESVVGHEYFHNWTGDRITCRDWFQLSLKEGLTVFRESGFVGDMRSAAVRRITDVKDLRLRQFQEDSGPLAHPVQPQSYIAIDNFYTATVYEKGAEIVGMIKTLLGARDCSARPWICISSGTTDRPQRSSNSCAASRTPAGARSISSACGMRRRARRKSWSGIITTRRLQDVFAGSCSNACRQRRASPSKVADAYSAGPRPDRPGQRQAAEIDLGRRECRRPGRTRAGIDGDGKPLCLHRPHRRACALAGAQFLRAGHRPRRHRRQDAGLPDEPRHGRLQPLGGRASSFRPKCCRRQASDIQAHRPAHPDAAYIEAIGGVLARADERSPPSPLLMLIPPSESELALARTPIDPGKPSMKRRARY